MAIFHFKKLFSNLKNLRQISYLFHAIMAVQRTINSNNAPNYRLTDFGSLAKMRCGYGATSQISGNNRSSSLVLIISCFLKLPCLTNLNDQGFDLKT